MLHPEMAERLSAATVSPELPLADALARLQQAGTGILLVVGPDGRLVGTVTDGDVRRHLLSGATLSSPCGELAERDPLIAPSDATPDEALGVMDHGREFVVNQLPLLDADRRACGLLLRSDLVSAAPGPVSAVIMAGGLGTRLRPLTDGTPKPMLRVGDRPLLEHTIRRLRAAGIRDIKVTTCYLPEQIERHFGDGHDFDVTMTYVREDEPLGTAGALRLVPHDTAPLLVVNGDVLTSVDYRSMLDYHRDHRACITVAVRKYDLQVPFGVIECRGARVRALREKPVEHFVVNAGIYLVEPHVLDFVPAGRRFDMTDLIQRALDEDLPVMSYPIVEYWLDIGRPGDYERAQADVLQLES